MKNIIILFLIISPILITAISAANSESLIITGMAIYNENKEIINPIYYTILTALVVLLIFITMKKHPDKTTDLIKEANELLKDKKEKQNYNNQNLEEPSKKEIKKEVKEKETKTEEKEIFKKGEEKLEEEIRNEIKEEQKI